MHNEVPQIETKADFIAKLDIFRDINSLGGLIKISREFEFRRGSVIAHKDDIADSLFIVREGQLQEFEVVSGENNELVYRRGRIYSAGDHFDDIWLFKPNTHPTLVRARRDGRFG